ncbi:integrase arm-type DNA-binding domain-containing protein [Arcobacter sp. F2176]|uniref:tyrosine-type recombinase/integrase n=1 Tax=Arcobacter sp. F2176 TaxID=2044511 RepID=UPI00100AF694|nr:integrase arm-type DNA-binding domain-containing protein [Arcobacter sp. F2176]RXJ79484.1 integrase [Arcobacter sp. F2176]
MARTIIPLTNIEIKSAKPKEKDYKLFDGGGLFLLVVKSGGKRWRLKYRFNNKEKVLSIGTYPTISLKDAREIRDDYKNLIAKGIDPIEQKRQAKEENNTNEKKKENTFYKVSQEWHKNYESEVSENYHDKLGKALQNYIYPFIKNQSIEDISRLNIIEILQDLKNKGIVETANRVYTTLNKIYKYAVTLEYTSHNIIADIEKKTILGKREKRHYPTFTKDKDIKALLLAINDYNGDYSTKMALKMLPYVFVRSFNIRYCEWSEIDFENKLWIIPKEKMKTKIEFILPLPNQVINLLNEIKPFSGSGKYVFPSFRDKDKPMSDNTIIGALRRMGYAKDELVAHSFRAMFSTIAYENANTENGHKYTGEVIEALLAHKEQNKIKAAYNRALYRDSMRGLIEWYAEYLDYIKCK